MNNGLTIDALLDALAARVAEKVRAELAQASNSGAIRPRLLTVEQAAVHLGRTEEAVRHLIASGRLRVVKIDRRVQVDMQDLDRLIEASKT